MSTLSPDMRQLHHEAMQRQARKRLDELEDMRAAVRAESRGLTQREIADVLVTSQPRVHRLLRAAARREDLTKKMPEELILQALVHETSRSELLDELKRFPYSFADDAPYPHEGRIPGTWDQVVAAYIQELLSENEFLEVTEAIKDVSPVLSEESGRRD